MDNFNPTCRLLFVWIFIAFAQFSGAQLSSGGGLPSGSLSKLVVAESGRVFVLDEKSGGAVYMLSDDISTVMMSPSNTCKYDSSRNRIISRGRSSCHLLDTF